MKILRLLPLLLLGEDETPLKIIVDNQANQDYNMNETG